MTQVATIDRDTAQYLAENGLNIRGEKQEATKMSDSKRQEAINCLEGLLEDLKQQLREHGSGVQGTREEVKAWSDEHMRLCRAMRRLEGEIKSLHFAPREGWRIKDGAYFHEDGIYAVAVYDEVAELHTRQYCKLTGSHSYEVARNAYSGSLEVVLAEAERRNSYIQKQKAS